MAEPLTRETLPPGRTAVILKGLLPEGEALVRLEDLFGAAPTDLLAIIGRETLGAVTILPGGEAPGSQVRAPLGPELSEADIADRIRGLGTRPLGVSPETPVRLSLPGAQPKLPLHRVDGAYFDPVAAVQRAVQAVAPPPDSPHLGMLLADVERLVP